MSILYIEDKLKEKARQQEIMKLLSEIGLDPKEIPDLINKEDTLMDYQEWVKERFFQEYKSNNHKIITPKFGDKKEKKE